jgi:hypothetical protein
LIKLEMDLTKGREEIRKLGGRQKMFGEASGIGE